MVADPPRRLESGGMGSRSRPPSPQEPVKGGVVLKQHDSLCKLFKARSELGCFQRRVEQITDAAG